MIIDKSSKWREGFIERLENREAWDNWKLFKMSYEIAKKNLITDFRGLQSPNYLPNLKPLAHQLEAAETVIERMNGKAILADEVGLGKTIEAGLILKEYLIRGLVKKALILAPASLVDQWIGEMNQKFPSRGPTTSSSTISLPGLTSTIRWGRRSRYSTTPSV